MMSPQVNSCQGGGKRPGKETPLLLIRVLKTFDIMGKETSLLLVKVLKTFDMMVSILDEF
jgi:hypothetical protein